MKEYSGWWANFGQPKTLKAQHLETKKIWQDVFSNYPFEKPIADYWIFAGDEGAEIQRERYAMLDLFSDVGGLTFFIYLFLSATMMIFSKLHFSRLLAFSMYQSEPHADLEKDFENSLDVAHIVQRLRMHGLALRFFLNSH